MTSNTDSTFDELNMSTEKSGERADEKHAKREENNLFSHIPVSLTIELGRTEQTLAQLKEIKEGGVINLNKKANDPVILSCQGTPIAEGDIINIEGVLHLEITSLMKG